jgi:PAS domain S-box-containing protein
MDPMLYNWNPQAAASALTMVALLVLGLSVVVREQYSLVSRAFVVMPLLAAAWFFAFSWMYCAQDEGVALWWAKAGYLAVPFICASMYHFTLVVLGIYEQHRLQALAAWMVSAFFATSVLWSDALIHGVTRYWWGYYPRYSWLGIPFLAYFYGMMVATYRHYLAQRRRLSPGKRKMKIQWFLVAFAGTFAASFDFAAKLGLPIYPFGYLPILWWLLLVGYAIQRYRILDITPSLAARHIIETMADAVLVVDEEGVIRIANQAAANMFRTATPLGGQMLSSVDNGLWPKIELARWAPKRTIRQVEIATYSASSCPVILEVSASVISSRSNEPLATVCVFRDVSDRRRVELELRRCQALLDHTRSLVYFTDAEHRFVLVNRHFEQVLNVRSSDVRGRTLREVFGVHAEELVRHHEHALEAELPIECEETISHGDGRHLYFSVKVPLFYQAGSPYGVCNISTEVTGRRRTEEDRQRVVSQLQESEHHLRGTLSDLRVKQLEREVEELRSELRRARGTHL